MNHPTITMRELHDRLNRLSQNEVILDVRGRDEYAQAHVPGAINIPHEEVSQRIHELKAYERIYIHCHAGKRAQMAFSALDKAGLKNLVCVSSGGMGEWIAAGFETAKGSS